MIKKIRIAIAFLGLLVLIGCNEAVDSESENLPQTFSISDGMEVSLIAPTGFTLAQEFYGFSQVASFSRIQISEKEYPLKSYLEGLTKENLIKNKLQLLGQEEVEVFGALCTLMTLRQNIAGTYYEQLWLIAGDKLSSVQLEATYPEGASKKHKAAIRESLMTLSVTTDDSKRLFTGLPFTLTKMPHFKLKKRYANSVVLLPEGEIDALQTLVLSHGTVNQQVDSVQQLAEHFLKDGKYYKSIEILANKMMKLDGIPALATTASATVGENKVWVYQVLSFQKGRFMLLQGQSRFESSDVFSEHTAELLKYFQFR